MMMLKLNNMKMLTSIAFIVCVAIGRGEIQPLTTEETKLLSTRYDQLTDEQKKVRDAAARRRMLIEQGGEVIVPGTPKGTIRYINLQTRIPTNDLQRALKLFENSVFNYDVKIISRECDASLKIKIIDEPNAPRLVVAPDEYWATINIAKLTQDNPTSAFLAARTRKEMIRAFTFLTAGSQHGRELFGPIQKLSDFDKIVEKGLPFDIQVRTRQYLKAMGVEPIEKTTYRQLIEAGYTMKPQNEYQKAILENINAEKERGPVNGLKIAPPVKK